MIRKAFTVLHKKWKSAVKTEREPYLHYKPTVFRFLIFTVTENGFNFSKGTLRAC